MSKLIRTFDLWFVHLGMLIYFPPAAIPSVMWAGDHSQDSQLENVNLCMAASQLTTVSLGIDSSLFVLSHRADDNHAEYSARRAFPRSSPCTVPFVYMSMRVCYCYPSSTRQSAVHSKDR